MQIDKQIQEYGKNHKVPITLDDTLDFLIQTINENASKQILEIGTAIAFGTISMAENTNCTHIDSVEIDKSRFEIATNNVKSKGLENRITLFNIDAIDYLKNCDKHYDLVYLDGPKGQYINYLPYIYKILNTNGIIFADNLNFHGMVTGEIPISKGCRAMIKGLKKYISEITTNTKYISKIYQIGDGVGITRIIK